MPATSGIAWIHIHIFEPFELDKNILKQLRAHFLTRMFSLNQKATQKREREVLYFCFIHSLMKLFGW